MGIRRRRKKKVEEAPQEGKSLIGRIIDLPLPEFEKELKRQKVNIGTIHNLELHLQGVYNDLVFRKDAIFKRCDEGALKEDDPEVRRALKGLYAEMLKIEEKVLFLKKKYKELIVVDDIKDN